ncbi:MAG: 5-formyltetrahydrofolate cyclo-ligase [Phycisphaerales bacterium]|nr:5-formyltetrahydrofolate cyclo-ligase [Phycisphaerales bacterium]
MSDALGQAKAAARAELRQTLEGIRGTLPTISQAIGARLAQHDWWLGARTVMVFAPMAGEVDLSASAKASLAAGQRVCLPRVHWASGGMTPVAVQAWENDVVIGKHGVPEPRPRLRDVAIEDVDVVVTPGLGFDLAGNRLGRGAGFYDRFLMNAGLRAVVAGVCPEAAIRESIPAGATDVPVRFVVTERRTISCGGS